MEEGKTELGRLLLYYDIMVVAYSGEDFQGLSWEKVEPFLETLGKGGYAVGDDHSEGVLACLRAADPTIQVPVQPLLDTVRGCSRETRTLLRRCDSGEIKRKDLAA